jgi:catechol 2,3-dioxygenase-like lactoylglutathione lyase family enzyme
MIQRLSHVTLFVNNQDEAKSFYVDKLGFEVRTDRSVEGVSNSEFRIQNSEFRKTKFRTGTFGWHSTTQGGDSSTSASIRRVALPTLPRSVKDWTRHVHQT